MGIYTRRAKTTDIDWLIDQLKQFSRHYGTKKDLLGDEEHARAGLKNTIENHLLLIAEKPEFGPVGLIAGIVTPHLYNPKIKILAELFWWVEPRHRRSAAGLLLLEDFISWGKENSDWITFGVMTNTPVKEEALLERGFALTERSYLLEVA